MKGNVVAAEPRTVYLLGAGASRDAGLPVSMGLTQRIGELIQEDESFEPSPYGYDPPVGPLTQAIFKREMRTRESLQAELTSRSSSPPFKC